MIDRKLLKANRWEDEEYLHARRTNALYNGGGGGRGGGGGGEREGGDADLQSTTHGGRNTSSRKGNLQFRFVLLDICRHFLGYLDCFPTYCTHFVYHFL